MLSYRKKLQTMPLKEERAAQLMKLMDDEFWKYKVENNLDIPMDEVNQLFQIVPFKNDLTLRIDNSLLNFLHYDDIKHFEDYFDTL
jgi:hypothetical protein